jgi:hypothetical protein
MTEALLMASVLFFSGVAAAFILMLAISATAALFCSGEKKEGEHENF